MKKTLDEAVTITPFEPPPDPPNDDDGEWQETPDWQGGVTILPPPTKPMDVARVVEKTISANDGLLKLRHWRGSWWRWVSLAETIQDTVDTMRY